MVPVSAAAPSCFLQIGLKTARHTPVRRSFLTPIVICTLLFCGPPAFAATTLDFWHSYVHAKTAQKHYGFHLSKYKRGLFVGPCGFSTHSLRWRYGFDLAGEGPIYDANKLVLSDDNYKPLHVVSGQIVTDLKGGTAKINIQIEQGGSTNQFIGNGEYRIIKLK